MKNRKSFKNIIIIILVFVNLMMSIMTFFIVKKNKSDKVNDTTTSSSSVIDESDDTDQGEIDKINRMTDEEKQKLVNDSVEDGMIAVDYSMSAVVNYDTLESTSFRVTNTEDNKDSIQFKLYDENDNVVYTSEVIDKGYECTKIKLDPTKFDSSKYEPGKKYEWNISVGYYNLSGNMNSLFPIYITFE